MLRKRRLFYEVKLHSWIVKHDIDGDKNIIKTIVERGVGYDRPFDLCEITLDMKVYTKEGENEIVYEEYMELSTKMTDKERITPCIKKIINSMKTRERVSCQIKPEFLKSIDQ